MALFLNRTLTRGQLQALFFSSVPRCNARLRQLFDWGFLSRSYLPTAPFGSQALYTVGKAALPLVTAHLAGEGLALDPEDVRTQCRRPALSLLEHTLAIGDVYIAVQRALGAQAAVRLECWLPERLCRHEYEVRRAEGDARGRWRKEVFQPDGFLRLTCRGVPSGCNAFLEVDRGHTNGRQFAGKVRTHGRYLASGLFAETFGGDEFRTLVITTGPKRADNLRALAEQEGSDLFWFTTFESVARAGWLAPIWRAPSRPALASLI